jgi:uncharacterized protein YciI
MSENRSYFFLKLIPCRPTFAMDMTDEERAVMMEHIAYWKKWMDEGRVVVFGPVMDPAGPYGMGVVQAGNEAEVQEFVANDPASKINRYEFYPMRAVLP